MTKIAAYFRLFRFHQPVGVFLLLSPACWGIFISYTKNQFPSKLFIYFIIGAIFARSAGCIINDIIDRDLDSKVERTKSRPLASGALSVKEALIGLIFCGLICLVILFALPPIARYLSLISIVPIVIYPFMKYVTYWPQLFLGFTFNLSYLIATSAVTQKIEARNILIYLGCVFWTLGYDTIYGHQDKKDDLLVNVKSTSIKLANKTKLSLTIFYSFFYFTLCLMPYLYHLKKVFYFFNLITLFHLVWQIFSLETENLPDCRQKFASNLFLGIFVSISILIAK